MVHSWRSRCTILYGEQTWSCPTRRRLLPTVGHHCRPRRRAAGHSAAKDSHLLVISPSRLSASLALLQDDDTGATDTLSEPICPNCGMLTNVAPFEHPLICQHPRHPSRWLPTGINRPGCTDIGLSDAATILVAVILRNARLPRRNARGITGI